MPPSRKTRCSLWLWIIVVDRLFKINVIAECFEFREMCQHIEKRDIQYFLVLPKFMV